MMGRRNLSCLVAANSIVLPATADAGPDDDAVFQSDGNTRNSIDPVQDGRVRARAC